MKPHSAALHYYALCCIMVAFVVSSGVQSLFPPRQCVFHNQPHSDCGCGSQWDWFLTVYNPPHTHPLTATPNI